MLTIDASKGEGGGQIVRSALTLSLVTGKPFALENIRAGKRVPGLGRQHVVAVQAAVEMSGGEAEGAQVGSLRLRFAPRKLVGGTHRWNVNPGGSAVLIAQMLVPALCRASEPSEIVVEGGTHFPASPAYEHFADSYLPVLKKLGADLRVELWRHGFPGEAGGALRVWIAPRPFARADFLQRGRVVARRALAKVAKISRGIAEREVGVLERRLRWGKSAFVVEEVDALGPGNIIVVTLRHTESTLVMTQLGNRDEPAEVFAGALADRMELFLATDAPIDPYLADQILVPMAMAGGGSFRTVEPTAHTRTQIDVLGAFLPEVEVRAEPDAGGAWLVSLAPR